MLVYRSVESVDDAGRMLDSVRDAVAAASRIDATHETLVDALLSSAELETASLDARFDAMDDLDPAERAGRRVTELAGSAVVASWFGARGRSRACAIECAGEALRELEQFATVGTVHRKVPEGFAYYAVYPELYADAAARFAGERRPECVTVIGIRTIGTALSAAVVAALRAHGIDAESCTVRPRGHPFDRRVIAAPRLQAWLGERSRGWFAIVDEGPGISGSSFAAVSRALSELGIPDDRTVLFPSWLPDPDRLRNPEAADGWRAHAKYVESFDRAFVQSGRLAGAWRATIESDWSGGRWREALCPDGEAPAVHPQHEQRKYLCRATDGSRLLLKFVGLGRYGRARSDVGARLADAQLGPQLRGARYGFLAMDLVDGSPADANPSRAHIEAVASYVARRAECIASSDRLASMDDLLAATRVNVCESLGEHVAERACDVVRALPGAPRSVAVDGRMQPHEWIRSGTSLVKTDGVAHHDDHFLQPPADPVWDLAGASVEWRLRPNEEDCLVREYSSWSVDPGAPDRMAACRVAYLAYRIGYTALAAETLGHAPDGRAMRALAGQYTSQLRSTLEAE